MGWVVWGEEEEEEEVEEGGEEEGESGTTEEGEEEVCVAAEVETGERLSHQQRLMNCPKRKITITAL